MMKPVSRLALGLGMIAVTACSAATAAEQRVVSDVRALVRDGETVLSARGGFTRIDEAPAVGLRTAVLPSGSRSWTVTTPGAAGGREVPARLLGMMRGLPVIAWESDVADAVVSHDGSWSAPPRSAVRASSRGFDAALAGSVPGMAANTGRNGSYVIIAGPDYAAAMEPLVAWKRDKGFEVHLVTTAETGVTAAAIQAWLRDAYAVWDTPPEYVLLVGDVDVIPAWFFSENVTDMPYALMNEGDWLPDLMVGRFSVANADQAAALVAKSVAYEKSPYRVDEGWFSRQLMVGGNYGSTTPTHTVHWVGEQLETVGFEAATEVMSPPFWNGVFPITQALENGVGMCVYRGWAYGTEGWEPPHFTNADIPGVDNGAMNPVVMSFVCLNNNFADADPCFGEVFTNQGTAAEPKGAVAFIGNGEHWSHTRYNDAMAISFFEAYPDPSITDLGSMMLAGRLRFMQFFPHELDAATYGEESVEFYFHIYNLLGDPELNMWKGAPRDMTVSLEESLPGFARRLDVRVFEEDGTTPLPGARIGVTAAGELVACNYSGLDGTAAIDLEAWNGTDDLTVTVTGAGRFALVSTVSTGTADSYLQVSGLNWTDQGGNGDDAVNPGEFLVLHPSLTNLGGSAAGTTTLDLTVAGAATVFDGQLVLASLDAGATHDFTGDDALTIAVPPATADGTPLQLRFDAAHDGDVDGSLRDWIVSAPMLGVTSAVPDGDGLADPGETVSYSLTLANGGSAATVGGSLTVTSLSPDVGVVTSGSLTFGALASGAETVAVGSVQVDLAAAAPVGSGLILRLASLSDEGYEQVILLPLTVGAVDAGTPVGPDAYGYWAVDSADLDYPALAPQYRWVDIDPARGGEGVPLTFILDNEVKLIDLPFAFAYYGTTYNGQIRISENGWISFDTSDEYEFYNWPLPGPHGNHSVVAPFWDNFDPTLEGTGGVFTNYDDDAGTLTVQWTNMIHYRPDVTDAQTFQLVLRDPAVHPTVTGDGEMLILYRQVLNTDTERQYATVGFEDQTEAMGLQLSYANVNEAGMAPIGPGLAVLITTEQPVRVPYALAAFTAERLDGGVSLNWDVEDSRPVVGWRVVRLTSVGAETLTQTLLPTHVRTFVDAAAPDDPELSYQLEAVHPYGHRNVAGRISADDAVATPSRFSLRAAWPNPAVSAVNLAFSLPRTGTVHLRIYDVAGRLVRVLHEGEASSGETVRIWDGRRDDGRSAAAGVYFARLQGEQRTLTRKVLLVR